MKHYFVKEQMLIVHNGLMKSIGDNLIICTGLKFLQRQIVNGLQIFRVDDGPVKNFGPDRLRLLTLILVIDMSKIIFILFLVFGLSHLVLIFVVVFLRLICLFHAV